MGYDNRNNTKRENTGRKYLEKDFVSYSEEVKKEFPRYKTTGLHPDVLIQAKRGYIRIYKGNVHPVTKKQIYKWTVLSKLDNDGKQIYCPFDEHLNFLNQYEKWRMSKAVKENHVLEGLEDLASTMHVRHDMPIENADELLEALEG